MQTRVAYKYANPREKPTTSRKLLGRLNNGAKVDDIVPIPVCAPGSTIVVELA